MAIQVTCNSCGHAGRVGDNLYGKVVKCPQCGQRLHVGPPPPPPEPPRVPLARPVAAEPIPVGQIVDDDDGKPYELSSQCPDCGATMTQNAVICVKCGFDVRTGQKHKQAKATPAKPYTPPTETRSSERSSSSSIFGSGEGGFSGIVWFILIFGVGNAILYYFTGWVIIPIRR